MSTERSTSWSQMTEHAQTLLAIRASLFDQFERDGCFSDALVQTVPATQRAGLLAPLAFGAEGVVIPLGLFSYIARTLDEKKGYLALKEKMTADSTLKRFAVERVKTTEERSRFEKLFEKAFPLLSEFSFERASNQLAPYAAQDVLDLDCWILAALVDLDDLFFMGPEFIAKIKDKQQQQHERAIEVVSDALGKLQGLLNLNYPSDANRRGWFGNLDIMKALNDLPITASEQRFLREKISGLPAAGAKREEWLGFIGKVLSHRNVVETTLVTTRAVLTFTVVAESAYREQETTSSAGVTERLKEAIGFFDSSGNDIFRAPAFGSFVLQEFIRLTALAVLPSEDYDAFIHTIGILSFAVTRGYFADGEDPERFRDDVQKLVPDRRTLVDMMLTAIEGGFEGVLVKQGSFVEKPNWFVATKNWQLLFDAEGKPVERTTPESKRLGDKHSFQFILALPLVVKALANISFEERLRVMLASQPIEWAKMRWPDWLGRVDSIAARLTNAMVERQLRDDGVGKLGVSTKGADVDLSITAGVVDALSLWCGALMLKSVADGELDDASPPPPEPGPVDQTLLLGLAPQDIAIVGGFFQLLRRWTGGASKQVSADDNDESAQASDHAEPVQIGMAPGESEWFHVLWQVLEESFDVLGDKYDWRSDDRQPETIVDFPQVLNLVGQIRFLQRSVPERQRAEILINVLKKLRKLRQQPQATFAQMRSELRAQLKREYPQVFRNSDNDPESKKRK